MMPATVGWGLLGGGGGRASQRGAQPVGRAGPRGQKELVGMERSVVDPGNPGSTTAKGKAERAVTRP